MLHHNAIPVFVDIDPRTFCIDPAQIEAAITPRTRAIMPVHLFGLPCDMDAICDWAEEKGLKYTTYYELIALPETRELIQSEIDKLSVNLARYETIKKFIFAKEPFTIDTGELTPSLKVKRNVVEKNYKEEIAAMYND